MSIGMTYVDYVHSMRYEVNTVFVLRTMWPCLDGHREDCELTRSPSLNKVWELN